MGYPTPIEWTDATWNPIGGCAIASPGCADCYAQKLAGTRLKNHPLYKGTTDVVKGKPVFNGKLTAAPADHPTWSWPLRWKGARRPVRGRQPSLIFVGDMSDLYHRDRAREVQDRVVLTILRSRHIGQLLTKRPDVMADHLWDMQFRVRSWAEVDAIKRWIWTGMSAERQKEFDARWPQLRRCADMGFTVFVSYEPAIGPLVLPADFLALGRRAQVIAGGMSGKDAIPAHPDWFRAARDQCEAAGVAFFFKQWGEWIPASEISQPGFRADQPVTMLEGEIFYCVGKKAAGRRLDGRVWNEFPALTLR